MEESQNGVTPGNLQETSLGMLTFFVFLSFFLPYTLSIFHLCCVHLSSVRNPKRQLENCLKKDHIVCANQSRQQNGMGVGVQHPASSQVTVPGMGRHYLQRAQYPPPQIN